MKRFGGMALPFSFWFLLPVMLLLLIQGCTSKYKYNQSSAAGPFSDEGMAQEDMEGLILGWREMIDKIDRSNPNVDNLENMSFKLKIKIQGEWDLKIYPERAFKVTRDKDGNHEASIREVRFLYDSSGGVVKRTLIQAEIKKMGGNRGRIDLSPNLECLYEVSFYQKNGAPLDFEKLEKMETLQELIFSDPKDIVVHSRQKTSLTLKRGYGSSNPAWIKIKLTEKKSGETYLSPPLYVPNCQKPEQTEGELEKSKFMQRTPGQCVVHLKGSTSAYEPGGEQKLSAEETFGNNCPFKVACNVNARYGLEKGGKIVFARKKTYPLLLAPNSWTVVNAGFDFTSYKGKKGYDAKIYSMSILDQGSLPKNYPAKDIKDFLDCRWAP